MIRLFRVLGYLEAISFLLLVGVAMPLKYLLGTPEAVRIVGMGHGLLFLAYILFATQLAFAGEWPKKLLALAYIAAVVPFGTIYFDRKLLPDAEALAPIR